jgi:chitinase
MIGHPKRRCRRLGAVLVVLLMSGRGADLATAAPDDKDPARVFVGYVYGPSRDINFRLYTHLCHAFVVADGEGRIQRRGNAPSRELTAGAHKSGVRVILSLGGWGWDKQFASIVAKPGAEDRYFAGVMEIVDTFDYDGIDLDWEYPDTKEEVAGFERLTRRFRKALDDLGRKKGRSMVVTMAASSNAETLKWLDRAFLLETMDWINVMTYDYTGNWTDYAGHHSPLFASSKQPGRPRSTQATMKYLLEERRLPANRLAVGIPLYGRGFNVAESYAPTKGAPRTRAPGGDYARIRKLEGDPEWTRKWDDQTKNPWLISTKGTAVIGYDDAESVAIKTDWAMKQGFRGVFFWQIHGDRLPDGTHPLQEASRREWEKAASKGR